MTHYTVLGVAATASKKQIKARFYELSKELHPDTTRSLDLAQQQQARDRFQQVKDAYDVLANPVKRADYDRSVSKPPPSAQVGSTRSARDYAQRPHRTGFGGGRPSRGHVYNYGRPFANPTTATSTGSNYDVPHFDFDKHLKQQQAYDRHRDQAKRAQEHKTRRQEREASYSANHRPPYAHGTSYVAGITVSVLVTIAVYSMTS